MDVKLLSTKDAGRYPAEKNEVSTQRKRIGNNSSPKDHLPSSDKKTPTSPSKETHQPEDLSKLRVTEEGPETTRERQSKVANHKSQFHSGILFPKKAEDEPGHDSEAEDIQQHIAEIDRAESEYNSERVRFGSNHPTESDKNQNVKYLDLKTKNICQQENATSEPLQSDSKSKLNSGVKGNPHQEFGNLQILSRIYDTKDLPEYTESPNSKHSPEQLESRQDLRLIESSTKVVYVPDSELTRLLKSKCLQKSPQIKKNSSAKKNTGPQKPRKAQAANSSYYTNLLSDFEKNPGYGVLN